MASEGQEHTSRPKQQTGLSINWRERDSERRAREQDVGRPEGPMFASRDGRAAWEVSTMLWFLHIDPAWAERT